MKQGLRRLFSIFIILLLILVPLTLADPLTSGNNYAGDAGTGSFTNKFNAVGSEVTNCASAAGGSAVGQNYNTFGFTLPTTVTAINGIKVETKQSLSAAGSSLFTVYLRKTDGGANSAGKTYTETSVSACGAGQGIVTYGGLTDLWGTTWTPTEVNATSFTVRITVDNAAGPTRLLNWVRVTVNFTLTTSTTTTTVTSTVTSTITSTTTLTSVACVTPPVTNKTYTFFDGFESGNFTKWNSTAAGGSSSVTVSSLHPINGTYSMNVTVGSGANQYGYAQGKANLTTLGNNYWFSWYINIETVVHVTNKHVYLLSLRNTTASFARLALYHNGTAIHQLNIEVYDPSLGTLESHSTEIMLMDNRTNHLEFHLFKNATNGYAEAYLNGTSVVHLHLNKSDYSAYTIDVFRVGSTSASQISSFIMRVDNVAVDGSRIGSSPYTCEVVSSVYYGDKTPLMLIFVLIGLTMGAVLLMRKRRS